ANSYGINADFGTKAVSAFSDAISTIAAGTSIGLREKGPIPDKQKHEMLIVGTAIGSFGFEFELPREKEADASHDRPVEKAVSIFQGLLERAATGSDD